MCFRCGRHPTEDRGRGWKAWGWNTVRQASSVVQTNSSVFSDSQSISKPNRLSIIRNFVERVAVDVKFAEAGDEIRGYLWAKLNSLHRELYVTWVLHIKIVKCMQL